MGRKNHLAFLLLAAPAMVCAAPAIVYAASPIICESIDPDHQGSHIWPNIYLSNLGELCFNVQGGNGYSGKNCVTNGGEAHWTSITIVMEDLKSWGRDYTNFRSLNPVINDDRIEYTIEWSRGNNWRTMQDVTINRITGAAVSRFVSMHGGEPLECRLGKKAI